METILGYAERYQTEIAVVGGVLVLLLLAWLAWRAFHHRRTPQRVERPTDTVRRPLYLDADLLDDLRAHADDGDAATDGDRRHVPAAAPVTAGGGTTTKSERTERTRRLNDTLAALDGAPVLIDLDADPTATLSPGKAVVLTGTLERHPASDAAEILELSAPLLQRIGTNGDGHRGGDGDSTATAVRGSEVAADAAPLVVRLDHPSAAGGHLLVLPRRHLLVDDPVPAGTVSVLAVVERVVGRRETLAVEDYLGPHLSGEGRGMLADRDLAETVATLSDVTREDLGADELHFQGPGALLTPAAIHR